MSCVAKTVTHASQVTEIQPLLSYTKAKDMHIAEALSRVHLSASGKLL